ncbi:MAG: prepilin-type N-terminal cleavage/methylation domain-containing protein, partial [Nitrospirota bacterium]
MHPRSNRRSKFRSQEGGFTLLEIMIVVVIVGIAAALAVPNLTFMYAKYEL